jgi:aconitase A
VPLIVLTGKEYGSVSSRDWAARAPNCSASSRCWRRETVRAERNGDGTEFTATVRIDTPAEAAYFHHGGILQFVLRQLLEPDSTEAVI